MCRNCVCKYGDMGNLGILTLRLATLIVLHAAVAGFAYPTVLVTRPMSRVIEWLPTDNQTIYTLREGEVKSLELNTTLISRSPVHITISPCNKDVYWGLYRGPSSSNKGQLTLLKEYAGLETFTYTLSTSKTDKYLLQLSSKNGGGAAVSVRGETSRLVRMRLRIKSRRRLSANWDPSPIDPQETTYCVVASHQRNYTSLCAAQYDMKTSRLEKPNHFKSNAENTDAERLKPIPDNGTIGFAKVDNAEITNIDSYRIFEGDYNNIYRRKKFSRSTKVTDKDPVIACVGERTHHLIENLDPSTTYYVSVFGVARDRPAGTLLASGRVRPRTSAAKRLRENVPYKADVKGKVIYYFKVVEKPQTTLDAYKYRYTLPTLSEQMVEEKATVGPGGGLWLGVTTCGGAVDVEVLVRGKRLFLAKDIDPQQKLFVPAPIFSSSVQETSDEGSVQFDSSSEEARMRYVIKIVPSRWDRESGVNVEIVASTSRWGINSPEISQDAATVRELRPRRSCKSVDIAFLPASHRATDVIRYCVVAYDLSSEENVCTSRKTYRTQCANRTHKPPVKVITQKINGLKSGRKYAIRVTASIKGNTVPYNVLYVDTNISCKN